VVGGTSEVSLLGDHDEVFEVPQLHDITDMQDPINWASLPARSQGVNVRDFSEFN
jgi:hypothetical protein